jgi:hypothetical protein
MTKSIKINAPNIFFCRKCETILPLSEKSGNRPECKECRKIYNAELYLRSTKVRNDAKPKMKSGPKPGPRPYRRKQIVTLKEDDNNENLEIVKIEYENIFND